MITNRKIDNLIKSVEFYDNVLINYLQKLKDYANKYSLIDYLYNNIAFYKNGYNVEANKFLLVELLNNKYLFISNFYTCIYDAETHKTLDLNQLVKDKYNLKSDVYLSTVDYILPILNANSNEVVITQSSSKNKDNYTISTLYYVKDNYTTSYFLNSILTEQEKIYKQNIKDTWQDYLTLQDYLTFLIDINEDTKKTENIIVSLDKLSTNITMEFFNLQDNADLKDTYIPFTFFNITDDDTFECAYILVDIAQGKIIFPNKNVIIDLFKNQLLTDDSQIVKSNYIYETFDFKNSKSSKFIRNTLLELQDKTDVKEMMQLVTKKIFNNHKKLRNIKNADKFAYNNSLYYTNFITPIIYGKTDYPLYNLSSYTVTPFKRLKNNIFSIKLNGFFIRNTLYNLYTSANLRFTEFINTAFIINKYNDLQYKTNLVLPIRSTDNNNINTITTVSNSLSNKIEYIPEFKDTIFRIKKDKKINNIDNTNYIIIDKDMEEINKIKAQISYKFFKLNKQNNYIPDEITL